MNGTRTLRKPKGANASFSNNQANTFTCRHSLQISRIKYSTYSEFRFLLAAAWHHLARATPISKLIRLKTAQSRSGVA